MTRAPRRRTVGGVAIAAACARWSGAGCAPHLVSPPTLEPGAVRARFETQLHMRTERGARGEGELSVWVHRQGADDPPGVSARLWLESPDAFRIRVDGLVGTALEAAGRGDSLVVDAPALKFGAVTHDAADAGGRGDVGGLVWRLLAAGWRPPDAAWDGVTRDDSLFRVAWVEAGDTLSLTLGAAGLPAEARLTRGGDAAIVARYERWQAWDRIPWPTRIVVGDADGRTRATLKVDQLHLRPAGSGALVGLRVPRRALDVPAGRWLELLERLTRDGAVPPGDEEQPR